MFDEKEKSYLLLKLSNLFIIQSSTVQQVLCKSYLSELLSTMNFIVKKLIFSLVLTTAFQIGYADHHEEDLSDTHSIELTLTGSEFKEVCERVRQSIIANKPVNQTAQEVLSYVVEVAKSQGLDEDLIIQFIEPNGDVSKNFTQTVAGMKLAMDAVEHKTDSRDADSKEDNVCELMSYRKSYLLKSANLTGQFQPLLDVLGLTLNESIIVNFLESIGLGNFCDFLYAFGQDCPYPVTPKDPKQTI